MACASGLLELLVLVRNVEKGDGPGDDDEVPDFNGHREGQQGATTVPTKTDRQWVRSVRGGSCAEQLERRGL